MAYTSNSSIPTLRDQSYVMLVLMIGTLKRNVFEMVSFNNFPIEQENTMIDFGVKLMEGSITPEAYINKLEAICKSVVSKSIKFTDDTKAHLAGRLNLSRTATTVNQKLGKETEKKVKNDGTLKQISESKTLKEDWFKKAYNWVEMSNRERERWLNKHFPKNGARKNKKLASYGWAEIPYDIKNSPIIPEKMTESESFDPERYKSTDPVYKEDPRYKSLSLDDQLIIDKALAIYGLEEKPITKEKIDSLVKNLRREYDMFNPFTQETIDRIFVTLAPKEWKQFKPEPVVQDMQLNSVIKEDDNEEVAEDTRYELLPFPLRARVQLVMLEMGLIDNPKDLITPFKVDLMIKHLKKVFPNQSERGQYNINKLLIALDPKDWKKLPVEPIKKDFQLNSVIKESINKFYF